MPTQRLNLTRVPLDVEAALTASVSDPMEVQNMSASRRVFLCKTATGAAPDPGVAPARVLPPGGTRREQKALPPEKLWAWAEGPASTTLIVDDAPR